MKYPRHSPHLLACRRSVRHLSGQNIVVGLSGGADSLALVAACLLEGVAVEAVVVDHQLQEGSGEIAKRACQQARDLGAKAQVVEVVVPGGGDGMEAEARRVRYQALHRVAAGRPVAVAHTADDQAETLVISALRGMVSGMSKEGQVLRPFLGIRRADTEGACAELGLEYWQDPHNEDPSFLRVAVRTRVMGVLADVVDKDPVPMLAAAADAAASDNAYLSGLAGEIGTSCEELAQAAEPVRRRAIIQWLVGHDVAVNKSVIDAVSALCTDWKGQGGVAVGKVNNSRLEVHRINGTLALIEAHTGSL